MGEILLSADFSDYADDTEDCRMTRPFHANPRNVRNPRMIKSVIDPFSRKFPRRTHSKEPGTFFTIREWERMTK